MLKQKIHYWNCSKFADWVRGEKKPCALEWGQWDEWKEEQRKKRPWRFWFSDTFLGKLQNTIYYPIDIYQNYKAYVRNRWIDKTHYLKTGLKPGRYYDFDFRLMHGIFNELVDFVEIELAHLSKWNKDKKYNFQNGRCIDASYDYFKWANNLKEKNSQGKMVLSEQAKTSRKLKKIYEWWKNKRPNRPDPYDVSGWSEHYKNDDHIFDRSKEPVDVKKRKQILDRLEKIEKKYQKEDEDMMIELIKLRNNLWT